jgi:AcrR family transcriptional regulator
MSTEVSLRQAKKEQTRHAIATSALELFLARGFEEVSIPEIAHAAHVSKMTVFNYFPAKEDMFFEFTHGKMPDLGAAVRERPQGESPIAALRRFVRAELVRRAEWTGLHDGVADFSRLVFRSPTLRAGFSRIWREREDELLVAVAEAAGVQHPLLAPSEQLAATLFQHEQISTHEASPSSEVVILRLAVSQILSAIQTLTAVNQLRQALGLTADQASETALTECEAAFDLLESGLGSYGVPESQPRRA